MCEEEAPHGIEPPTKTYGTAAKLVWDGSDMLTIPDEMGTPSTMQLLGSRMEQVSELACRVCYDSLGKGRSSADMHEHILKVGHLSVYEHTHMTVKITAKWGRELPIMPFLNRPGVWIRIEMNSTGGVMHVTYNPRVVLDWEKFPVCGDVATSSAVRGALIGAMKPRCKAILHDVEPLTSDAWDVEVVKPSTDEEKWITMFLRGSRGFSHELVRHGDFTAISQRSTRYVDEDGSEWIDHPLVKEYCESEDPDIVSSSPLRHSIMAVKDAARETYALVAKTLQAWLKDKGVDKFTARKQARGAARGYLGNALSTEVIFSASVAQWKRMLRMRCCGPADAEIRAVFAQVVSELRGSRYGEAFSGFTLEPSSDGIGMVAVEK